LLKICSPAPAFVSSLLLALAPIYVNWSHLIKNTSFQILFYCLCLLFAVQFILNRRKKYLYLTSFICGLTLGIQVTGLFVFIMLAWPTLAYFSGSLEGEWKLKPAKEIARVILMEGLLALLGLGLAFPCLFLHPTEVIYQTYVVTMTVKQGVGILYPSGYLQIPRLLFIDSGFVGFAISIIGIIWYLTAGKQSLEDDTRKVANFILLPSIFFSVYPMPRSGAWI